MSWWPFSPPQARQVTAHERGFQVATMPCKLHGGFIAWAKRGVIVDYNPVDEPGEPVWFEFGNTRDEARARLLDKLGLEVA